MQNLIFRREDLDGVDVCPTEGVLRHQFGDGLQGGLIGADAGEQFVADEIAIPEFAELVRQGVHVDVVGDRFQIAAILDLEDILDAGEAVFGKLRGDQADPGGVAGEQPLHHRAILRAHQARRHRSGNAERVAGSVSIEAQEARRGRRRAKRAGGSGRMPAAIEGGDALRCTNACQQFIADGHRDQRVFAGDGEPHFGTGQQKRDGDAAGMRPRAEMRVVDLEALDHRRIGEHGSLSRDSALFRSPDAARTVALMLRELADLGGPWRLAAVEAATQRIQKRPFQPERTKSAGSAENGVSATNFESLS